LDVGSVWSAGYTDLNSCKKFTARIDGQAELVNHACARLFPESEKGPLTEKSRGRLLCLRKEVSKATTNAVAREAVFKCYERFPIKDSNRALEIASNYFPTPEEKAKQREEEKRSQRQMEEISRRIYGPSKQQPMPMTDCMIIGNTITCL
jgi:hypothetical protein